MTNTELQEAFYFNVRFYGFSSRQCVLFSTKSACVEKNPPMVDEIPLNQLHFVEKDAVRLTCHAPQIKKIA